ncbi:MAG: hypothetical protein AAFO87_01605 [Cyanobacteria bacterium J06607_6]
MPPTHLTEVKTILSITPFAELIVRAQWQSAHSRYFKTATA